jgi:CRISPR-associated protein Cas2
MLVWVIYDISDNQSRGRVAEKCKDYGLERLQKSAFLGELDRNHTEMLAMEIEDILHGGDDCVFILPMCSKCMSKRITIGRGFDEEQFKEKFCVFFQESWTERDSSQ